MNLSLPKKTRVVSQVVALLHIHVQFAECPQKHSCGYFLGAVTVQEVSAS